MKSVNLKPNLKPFLRKVGAHCNLVARWKQGKHWIYMVEKYGIPYRVPIVTIHFGACKLGTIRISKPLHAFVLGWKYQVVYALQHKKSGLSIARVYPQSTELTVSHPVPEHTFDPQKTYNEMLRLANEPTK